MKNCFYTAILAAFILSLPSCILIRVPVKVLNCLVLEEAKQPPHEFTEEEQLV